jgi:hypothetical protein
MRVTGEPALPSIVKVTVPVGVLPVPVTGATVAVNRTVCPTVEGLAEELRVVVVGAWRATALTTCATGAEELVRKLPVAA